MKSKSLILCLFAFRTTCLRFFGLEFENKLRIGALHVLKRPGYLLPDLSQKEFPEPPTTGYYDLVCIGSGPGGEAAAVHAMQLGAKHVAVIEQRSAFGGPTGLSSKAVREAARRICKAVDQIGGDRRRQVKGLWKRSFPVLKTEAEVLQASESRDRLRKNNIDLYVGKAELQSKSDDTSSTTTIRVCRPTECTEIEAKHVCIATGSRANKPPTISAGVALPFTKGRVICATEMGSLTELPSAVAIIGGGVIATEYATVLAELGVGVSLICPDNEFMPFLEDELRASLKRRMKRTHILFVTEPISDVSVEEDCVRVTLESRIFPLKQQQEQQQQTQRILPQRKLRVDLVLYSGGRVANSQDLGCEHLGIEIGKYGRIVVDSQLRTTSRSRVYAVGDVTGAGLASTAQQQARQLSERLFGSATPTSLEGENDGEDVEVGEVDEVEQDEDFLEMPPPSGALFGSSEQAASAVVNDAPVTLWTIPEIASVGCSASQASLQFTHNSILEGRGYFKDCARGRLSGDMDGFLKVVLRADSANKHTIVGVHILGDGANELIQLASILVHSGFTAEQVCKTPFAAVTLSGLFQSACDDALLKSPLRVNNGRIAHGNS